MKFVIYETPRDQRNSIKREEKREAKGNEKEGREGKERVRSCYETCPTKTDEGTAINTRAKWRRERRGI